MIRTDQIKAMIPTARAASAKLRFDSPTRRDDPPKTAPIKGVSTPGPYYNRDFGLIQI